MKTTIKRWLLASVFTGALAERALATHAPEWWVNLPDILLIAINATWKLPLVLAAMLAVIGVVLVASHYLQARVDRRRARMAAR